MEITLAGVFYFVIGAVFAGAPVSLMLMILISLMLPEWGQKALDKRVVFWSVFVILVISLTALLGRTITSGSGYDPHTCQDTIHGLVCND